MLQLSGGQSENKLPTDMRHNNFTAKNIPGKQPKASHWITFNKLKQGTMRGIFRKPSEELLDSQSAATNLDKHVH